MEDAMTMTTTVDELARILAAYQADGRGGERIVVRGYEGGLDDVARVVEAQIMPDARPETYYGPHVAIPLGQLSRDEPPKHEPVLWLIGSRDLDDGLVRPEGSMW